MTITYEPGECSAVEARADVASLAGLHGDRRAILPEYAALKALHGANGKWDNRRKQMLEAIKVRVRMVAEQKGTKVTEGLIDALAHADEQYAALLDEGISGAVRFVELDIAIHEIEERIRSREVELLVYNSEVKLAR